MEETALGRGSIGRLELLVVKDFSRIEGVLLEINFSSSYRVVQASHDQNIMGAMA